MAAKGIHHFLIALITEVTPNLATLRIRSPATIEADDSNHLQLMAYCSIHLHGVHAKGAIAMQNKDLLVWLGRFGAKTKGQTYPHGAKGTGVETMSWDKGRNRLPAI